MTKLEISEKCKALVFSGKNAYETEQILRKTYLRQENLDFALDEMETHLVNFQVAKHAKSKAFSLFVVGLTFFVIGAGVTLISYFSDSGQYLLAYGAILGGAWMAKEHYKVYRQPLENFILEENVFFQKRRSFRRF